MDRGSPLLFRQQLVAFFRRCDGSDNRAGTLHCDFIRLLSAGIEQPSSSGRESEMRIFVGSLLLLFVVATPLAAAECGAGGRCEIENGYYLAALPDDWDGKTSLSLVVYFHGWNASPEGSFRNKGMIRGATKRGAIFVAPFAQTGYWRQIGKGRAESGRDELAYVNAIMADIKRRWPIDDNKTMATGFSRGASMVWNVACYAGSLFHAYLPIAGGFWNSTPETCPGGPVNMRHIHGLMDRVVAYDTVGVYNSMSILDGMRLYRQINQCPATANATQKTERLECEIWSQCTSGKQLDLCTHPRGHSIRAEWVGEGLDWALSLPEK